MRKERRICPRTMARTREVMKYTLQACWHQCAVRPQARKSHNMRPDLTPAVTFQTKDWCFQGVLSELQLLSRSKICVFPGLIVFCFIFESLNVPALLSLAIHRQKSVQVATIDERDGEGPGFECVDGRSCKKEEGQWQKLKFAITAGILRYFSASHRGVCSGPSTPASRTPSHFDACNLTRGYSFT